MITIPLLKKINPEWAPSENPHLRVGETMEYPGDVSLLVQNGDAVIVDSLGNELPLPGTVFTCPVCFTKLEDLGAFSEHFVDAHRAHAGTQTATEKEVEKPSVKAEVTDRAAQIKANRLAALAKARATRKAKLVK